MVKIVFSTRQLDGANFENAAAHRSEFSRADQLLRQAKSLPRDPTMFWIERTLNLPYREPVSSSTQKAVVRDGRPGSESFVFYSSDLRHVRDSARQELRKVFENHVDALIRKLQDGSIKATFRDGGSVEVPELAELEIELGRELYRYLPWTVKFRWQVIASAFSLFVGVGIAGAWLYSKGIISGPPDEMTTRMASECGITSKEILEATRKARREKSVNLRNYESFGKQQEAINLGYFSLKPIRGNMYVTSCMFTRTLIQIAVTLDHIDYYVRDINGILGSGAERDRAAKAFGISDGLGYSPSESLAKSQTLIVSPYILSEHQEVISRIARVFASGLGHLGALDPSQPRAQESEWTERACELAETVTDPSITLSSIDRHAASIQGAYLFDGLLVARNALYRQSCQMFREFLSPTRTP